MLPRLLRPSNHLRSAPRTIRHGCSYRRISSLPGPLVPPLVFVGLAVSLWAYKCAMMVIFQNKIIYMPSMPPFSRSEKIQTYKGQCGPVVWEERRIRSLDGVELAVCVGEMPLPQNEKTERHVVVLYFQGNGSSTPPRLPPLSAVLTRLSRQSSAKYTLVALSYRGYWTSRGRPSQRGIELDAVAALRYIHSTYPDKTTSFVLWGQSIGAGVATGLVARHAEDTSTSTAKSMQNGPGVRVHGMVLETPFLSVKSMLLAMYPQKWLPYRYLWPFLRNWWDSEDAMKRIAKCQSNEGDTATSLPVLIVSAEHDELVPDGQAETLESLCRDAGMRDVQHVKVSGALHNDASARGEGMGAIVRFLEKIGKGF